MAPGASPLVPNSIPHGPEFAATTPPPVSDAGFLAFLSSGPAAAPPRLPIPAGAAGASPSNIPAVGESRTFSGPLTTSARLEPETDPSMSGGETDAAGPDPTGTPTIPRSQGTETLPGPTSSGTPAPAGTDTLFTARPTTRPVSADPETVSVGMPAQDAGTTSGESAPPILRVQGTGNTGKTAALSLKPNALAAISESLALPRSPIQALEGQPAVPVAATGFVPAVTSSPATQQPDSRAKASPATADLAQPPGRLQIPLRSEASSSVPARPETPQGALVTGPDATAAARPEAGAEPKPVAVTAARAFTALPATLPGAAATISGGNGPQIGRAELTKARGPVRIGPDDAPPVGARAAKGPDRSGGSVPPAVPTRFGAAAGPWAGADPTHPRARSQNLPTPFVDRPIVAPAPPVIRQPALPEPPPAPGPVRQGAVPTLPALPQGTAGPQPLGPPVMPPLSLPPAHPAGAAVAPIVWHAPPGLDEAAPPQTQKASDPARPKSPPGPQVTGLVSDRQDIGPVRAYTDDNDPKLPRLIEALPHSAPPLREGIAPAPTTAPSPTLARAEQIAAQIANYVATAPDIKNRNAPIEIALDPPELGQLRISVARGDDGMVLNVAADRPETLDLMRRHAGLLSQEFQRHGLDNAGFSFSGRDDGHPFPDTPVPDGTEPAAPELTADGPAVPATSPTDSTSLDIRI